MCGGTALLHAERLFREGLSPRVRGNLLPPAEGAEKLRSIPACAGEPRPPSSSSRATRVYPRVCGGTHPLQAERAWELGLSPRVPGEPRLHVHKLKYTRVYPRVCGGTILRAGPSRAA